MGKREMLTVYISSERMIVSVEHLDPLCSHSRVSHNYGRIRFQSPLHFPRRERAFENPQASVMVVSNPGCICSTSLTLLRQHANNMIPLRYSERTAVVNHSE